jgi:hypothetical protein
VQLAVGVGAAAGVAVGATALATSGPSTASPHDSDASVTASTAVSTTTTIPTRPHGFPGAGRFRGGLGAFGGFGGGGGFGASLGAGPAIYGQYTVKGPNGYETLSERTGTVSDVTDTAGSTWSITVKSADGTSGTFTVDSGTSVNGGETGIGSVKTGDTVQVTAVVSGSTSTAKEVIDETTLKANAGTWRPGAPQPDTPQPSAPTSAGAPPV